MVPDLDRLGATLVAVSPMLPDGSLSMAEKNTLAYEVLSDVGNEVARAYGLVFQLAGELVSIYKDTWNIDLPQVNGDDSWELPIPGTFVIAGDGAIRYAFVDPDYTRRAEPADIMAALVAD
jgi:peroxiredoxin